MQNKGIYRSIIKRLQDIVLSVLAFAILSPLMLSLAVLVRIKLGSPILFIQERVGRNEKIFRLYKFRTMTEERDSNGELLPDHKRLTKFGMFLRTASLDELPELWNILRGDMTIIGPRPLLVEYLELYNEEQRQRHKVRPGLSGLAQVNGRNLISWKERFDLDIKYVNHVSFLGDWKLIFLSVKKVLIREGISSNSACTMERFQGSSEDSGKTTHVEVLTGRDEDGNRTNFSK